MNKQKIYRNLIMLFLALYPIFDIKFFYHPITTLIRIIIILTMLFLVLMQSKEARDNFKWIIGYYGLVLIYFYFHHQNALVFSSLIPGNFNYILLEEALQAFKMTTPLIFLFTLYYLKFTDNNYYLIIRTWVLIICGSIIILNIFGLSYGSYSDVRILGNIFTWFSKGSLTYYDLASKGLFMYANQISIIILLILPVVYYEYTKSQKRLLYWLIILIMFCGLILGTRIASIGALGLLFICLLLYLFFSLFIKAFVFKVNILINSLLIMIVFLILLPISPVINRKEVIGNIKDNDSNNNLVQITTDTNKMITEDMVKIDYITENYKAKRIHETFILQSYPYQHDPDFWYDILQLPVNKRINYRFLEITIIKRVIDINNNKNDILFGITNTRIQNIFNIERDFILQYYAFGIIGMILFLGIYLYLFIIIFKKMIINLEYKTCIYMGILIIFLLAAFLTGNILNHLSTNLVFIFIISPVLKLDNVK
jgi:hypothetical protein